MFAYKHTGAQPYFSQAKIPKMLVDPCTDIL